MENIDFLVVTTKDVEAAALNQYGFESAIDGEVRGHWTKALFNTTMGRPISIVHYTVGERD
ncbi:MAG: hypothetical protein ACW99U_01885 [Candidatus Thorarchaeota archaeon]|jgi:hypothetical protein